MKKNKKSKLQFKFNTRYWFFIIPALTIFVVGAVFFSSNSSQYTEKLKIGDKNNAIERCDFRRVVDGVCLPGKSGTYGPLVAVMVENHPAARPQVGLAQASVVYEAQVEGAFSRFMALYPIEMPVEKVGPVRSARPYYLDWVAEWGNPLYMHVGGSPEALQKILKNDIFNANEFYAGSAFWRDSARYAPHNTYTNSGRWNTYSNDHAIPTEHYTGWNFTTSTGACTTGCIDTVNIRVTTNFSVDWKYSSSTSQYVRHQENTKHLTEDGELVADTIVIQEIKTKVIDYEGRLSLQTIGQGPAVVVYNGQKITGTWKKSARTERTRFYNDQDQEISFKPGKIWIEIVPRMSAVTFN